MSVREALRARIVSAITGGCAPAERDALLLEVARHQHATSPIFARLCAARGGVPSEAGWPAIPTDVFRHARVATWNERTLDVRTFRTSGTSGGARGEHVLRSLELYDLAAERAARDVLFGDRRMRLAMLAPHPDEVPDSSLSYMLGRFEHWFGSRTDWCWRRGALELGTLHASLQAAIEAAEPIAILGTSFALMHAEEALEDARFELPSGSLIMPTGGFKGRAKEIDPEAMRALLAARYGIDAEREVIGEYGMTELSSQMYEQRGTLRIPAWVKATPVDPETLRPVREGEVGILRIDDLANLDTAVSIQTSDLARLGPGAAIALLGRAPGATPRGCSLAIEEALS